MSLDNIPDLPLSVEAISEQEEIKDESGGCRIYAFIGSRARWRQTYGRLL